MAYVTIEELEALPEDAVTDVEAWLARMQEISDSVPCEMWDLLPPDLAEHFEEYKSGRRQYHPNDKSS